MEPRELRAILTTGLLLGAGCASPTRPPPGTATKPAADSPEIAIVRSAVKAFNAHDPAAVVSHYAPAIKWYGVTADGQSLDGDGAENVRAWLVGYFTSTPGVRSEIESVLQVGPHVAFREYVTWTGKDGRPRAQRSLGIYEIKDGAIHRAWYYPADR